MYQIITQKANKVQIFTSTKVQSVYINILIISSICLSQLLASFSLTNNFEFFIFYFSLNTRKIFIDGKPDISNSSPDSYQGISGKTQVGTWWSGNNGLTSNIEIDTIYIIDKAIEYTPIDQQLCFAKALNSHMP